MNWFQAGLYLTLLGMFLDLKADVRRLEQRPAHTTATLSIIATWVGVLIMVVSAFTGH